MTDKPKSKSFSHQGLIEIIIYTSILVVSLILVNWIFGYSFIGAIPSFLLPISRIILLLNPHLIWINILIVLIFGALIINSIRKMVYDSEESAFKKVTNLIILGLIASGFLIIDVIYPTFLFIKIFYSFITITIIYLIVKIIIEAIIVREIKDYRMKYSVSKLTSIFYYTAIIIGLGLIWIEDPEYIIVSLGVLSAGVVIAIRDFLSNFVGGMIILVTRIYRVGDRIEIDNKIGDVIDIGIFYTTLMEIQEWVSGDQATGRLSIIPNRFVLNNIIDNYTKDNEFIWDEIMIPISYDSDWKEAKKIILEIVNRENEYYFDKAQRQLANLEVKYYTSKRLIEPAIYLTITDNWITFNIRYVVPARKRRTIRDKISRLILEAFKKNKNIKISSTTMDVSLHHSNQNL